MASSTILGLPIEGEPVFPRRDSGIEQWGEDKFSELLKPLIESSRVEAVQWTQYTPYFNDGDVCEFSVGEAEIKVNDLPEEANEDAGFHAVYSEWIEGGYRMRWVRNPTSWGSMYEPYGDPLPEHKDYEAFCALSSAMNRGYFEQFLYDKFGDHAEVTVYKDRITVECYDHD
ncbi:hypothetical protein [Nonomuraea sp. NPDC049141]|uniref:hypothetical protein n=1 Tax=Nonomuraea sp. NPDC049141 TaxID=3155500 RepID=UPI0033E15A8E